MDFVDDFVFQIGEFPYSEMLIMDCHMAIHNFSDRLKGNHVHEKGSHPPSNGIRPARDAIMTLAPSDETKPTFTPEQREVLGRVYSYLMDIARNRSFQQKPVGQSQALVKDKHSHHQEEAAHSHPIISPGSSLTSS